MSTTTTASICSATAAAPIPIPATHLKCSGVRRPLISLTGGDEGGGGGVDAQPIQVVSPRSHGRSSESAVDDRRAGRSREPVPPSPSLALYLDFCFAVPTGWARLVCMDVFRHLREQQHESEDADEAALATRLCMSGFDARALYPIDPPPADPPPPPAFVLPASVYRPLLLVSSSSPSREEEEGEEGEGGESERRSGGDGGDDDVDGGSRIIVDMRFREQFCICRPTPRYEELLRRTPPVFVGPLAKLLCGARVLCREMEASFAHRGMPLPPWRRSVCVMYRWSSLLSRSSRSEPGGSGPGPDVCVCVLEARRRRRREQERRADMRRHMERVDAFASCHNASPQR